MATQKMLQSSFSLSPFPFFYKNQVVSANNTINLESAQPHTCSISPLLFSYSAADILFMRSSFSLVLSRFFFFMALLVFLSLPHSRCFFLYLIRTCRLALLLSLFHSFMYGKSVTEQHMKTWSQDKISWKRDQIKTSESLNK